MKFEWSSTLEIKLTSDCTQNGLIAIVIADLFLHLIN